MKHRKKRNTGLLYEFLVRYVSEKLVEGDARQARKATKLIRRYFKSGTKLYQEFRLFHALMNTYVQNEGMARRIIESVREQSTLYDVEKLEREKSLLIRGINHTLRDPQFFNKKIDEYRQLATIQSLLDEWRRKDVQNRSIIGLAQYEQLIVEYLLTPKSVNILEEQVNNQVDDLILNLMFKRVGEKYKGILNNDQIKLVNSYISSKEGDQSKLRENIKLLRESVITAIEKYQTNDVALQQKLQEVCKAITHQNDEINDETFSRYLCLAQLKQEIIRK